MRNVTGLAVAALVALSAVAYGADDNRTKSVKAKIAYFDKHQKKLKDPHKFAELVYELGSTGHALAAKRIGKILLKSKDVERKMIAADVLSEFKDDPEGKAEAGKALVKAFGNSKMEIDVLDTMANTVGKLEYKPAVPALCEILRKGGDPWLLLTTVRAVGKLKDMRALPTLLELWERNPVGYSWETGEVTVDTGAPGTADQEAAEAEWNAKYGATMKGKGKPPVMLKIYIKEVVKAVHNIVGEKINQPSDLRKWMEARRKELAKMGIEIPKYKQGTRKKKDDKDDDDKKKKD